MKSISKLKDEARRYEQREEWEKAIQAYLQVLRIADEGEAEVELPLYNRLGDLCVRLGKPQEAVRHYEQAADRYAEAGLYNNAIALCNKALRYNPDRLELVRKLGQFSASQGFITDARRYFLDYAERQFKAGKVTEALSALEDFANVSDDAEVREMLGRQLHAHGRINDAVSELRRAHAMRLREGNTQRADTLRAEILAIDPHAGVDGAAPATVESAMMSPDRTADLPGLVEIEPAAPDALEVQDPRSMEIEGLETGALPGDAADHEPIELAGFDTTGETELADIDATTTGGVEGLETTTFDGESAEPEAPAFESLAIEREEISFGDADGTRDAETFELPTLDEPFELPTLDEPETSFDLPLIGEDEPLPDAVEAAPPPSDGLPGLDTGISEEITPDLGGDLPLDLTSLGPSPFDMPSLDEEAGTAMGWETSEPVFDLPTLDDEALDLPGWTPEREPAFDLAAFDTEPETIELPTPEEPEGEAEELPAFETPETRPDEEAPVFEAPEIEPSADGAAESDELDAPFIFEVDTEPPAFVDVPAIELPTWDTDPAADRSEDEAIAETFEEPTFEAAEPTWVQGTQDEDDETSPDLPTFTYDDDEVEPAVVDGTADERETPQGADYDPLGLAAHLTGHTAPPPETGQPESGALDSDWLDDIADDEPDAEVPPLDTSTDDAEPVAEEAGVRDTAVEDVAAGTARAGKAKREMTPPPAAKPAPADNGYIDLGALISSADEVSTRFRVEETAPTGDEERDFAELLSQFKSKVQEHLPPEDAAAHYDLGLAFKEMGLVDEAIGEFQIAMRAGHMRLKVYEELGQCFLQKEQYNIAEKVLSRALALKFDDELELLGVYYHLGRAYEALGRRDQARDAYERVLGMDINFEDVTDRLARL